MKKNQSYTGEVTALGSDTSGIVKVEGTTAFVPFCLVGEKVTFRALKVGGTVAYGKLEKVITPSYSRVNPVCPAFGKCGGCTLQHAEYSAQLLIKRQIVATALKKIGGIDCEVSPCVASAAAYRYRNKLVMPVGRGENGAVAGFYAPRSHRIVPVDDCPIQAEWVKTIIYSIKKFCDGCGLSGYSDEEGGDVRQISVRDVGGKFIIVVVAAKYIDLKPLEKILAENFGEFTLLLNVNASKTNAVFSNEWRICRGEGFFGAEDCGVKFRAGANTFLQVNDGVRGKLYAKVADEAQGYDCALDLYSGGGMLTAMLARRCGRVYGVESVAEASRCADELKALNGLENMNNICGKVEDVVSGVLAAEKGSRKVVVCDPPRKGMERSATLAVANSGAEKIILVSCNPATLARDAGLILGTLKESGGGLTKSPPDGRYRLVSVTPFDMFPQTSHVETVAVLEKSP